MKKYSIFLSVILLACVCAGCPNNESGGVEIWETNLTDVLDFPMVGNVPQTNIDTPWFQGTAEWFYTEDEYDAQDGFFEPFENTIFTGSIFRSVLTLTAKDGFTFTGIPANTFTHEYAYAARNSAGNSTKLVVTLDFPFAPYRNTNPVTMTNLLYTIFTPLA